MSAVTKQEIVEALRGSVGAVGNAKRKELADRIERHGIALNWPTCVLNRYKTLEVLKRHNEWRRGAAGPQIDPRMLGLALDAAIAYIEHRGIAPPDGWVLVPRKLTTEMLLARNSNSWPSILSDEAEAIWDAFLAAAPEVINEL